MFLASPWWRYVNFQTEQFKAETHFANFGQVKIDPIFSFLLFGQVTVVLLYLGKTYRE